MYLHPHKLREHKYRHIIIWSFGCVMATLVFFGIYVVAQQSFRQSANFPQTNIVKETVTSLNKGISPQIIVGNERVDMAESPDSFIIIYDVNGQPIVSSGYLDGKIPVIQFGVLQFAKDYGQNTRTWQPRDGVRVASVSMPYDHGFVVVGRSLKETEERIDTIGSVIFWAWLTSVALISLVTRMFALFWVKCYSSSR